MSILSALGERVNKMLRPRPAGDHTTFAQAYNPEAYAAPDPTPAAAAADAAAVRRRENAANLDAVKRLENADAVDERKRLENAAATAAASAAARQAGLRPADPDDPRLSLGAREAMDRIRKAKMQGRPGPYFPPPPRSGREWERYFDLVYGPGRDSNEGDPAYEESLDWHPDPHVLEFYKGSFEESGETVPHEQPNHMSIRLARQRAEFEARHGRPPGRGRGGKRKTKKRKTKKRKTKKRVSKKYA